MYRLLYSRKIAVPGLHDTVAVGTSYHGRTDRTFVTPPVGNGSRIRCRGTGTLLVKKYLYVVFVEHTETVLAVMKIGDFN